MADEKQQRVLKGIRLPGAMGAALVELAWQRRTSANEQAVQAIADHLKAAGLWPPPESDHAVEPRT